MLPAWQRHESRVGGLHKLSERWGGAAPVGSRRQVLHRSHWSASSRDSADHAPHAPPGSSSRVLKLKLPAVYPRSDAGMLQNTAAAVVRVTHLIEFFTVGLCTGERRPRCLSAQQVVTDDDLALPTVGSQNRVSWIPFHRSCGMSVATPVGLKLTWISLQGDVPVVAAIHLNREAKSEWRWHICTVAEHSAR